MSNPSTNEVIIDGVTYDGPEGEEDMAIALRRIQMALERKKKKENEAKAQAEKLKKKKDDDKGDKGGSSNTVKA
ncbi:hypothetical protein AgCh_038635 [Apium graveolens]